MTGIGGGHDGVAAGTFCEDTTSGETVCGVGCFKTSERQRTRGLRTGAYTEFGSTGISDVSGSSAMTYHLAQEPVSLEHHLTWKGLQTEDH